MSAAGLLDEICRMMELKGENPFKCRAYEKAARALEVKGCADEELLKLAQAGRLTEISGIGKGIAEVLTEFLTRGDSSLLKELKGSLPPGLLELTEIPGLGPKKAMLLIEELGIQTVGELEYACRENRLLKLKGFGEKIQAKILEGIHFRKATEGFRRLDEALEEAGPLLEQLREAAGTARVSETGELRRRVEIVSRLEYVIDVANDSTTAEKVQRAVAHFEKTRSAALPIDIHYCGKNEFGYELARTTASEAHWKALGQPKPFAAESEEKFFDQLSLEWIAPELRESGEEVELARAGKLQKILPEEGIQGIFHNHTTRSDGTASLEEMVAEAEKQGYRYIGISDHSQSAFYASGLKSDVLKAQEKEVRDVQERHPDVRVFWGIESDILADGSLDYPEAVLKRFDFVIASVHSRFQMDREAMTDRILEAIRNPYTRFLGHATGRLLLGRKGYDLDMEKVIAEAAAHDVAIELNANPARLDIDWRWGSELRRRKTKISVNPDAHGTDEIANTRFGITMARKALVPSSLVVNSQSPKEVEKWLRRA